MKNIYTFLARAIFPVAVAALCSTAQAEMQPTKLVIKEVYGTASYSVGGNWQPLAEGMKLATGAVLKTGADSTVDLLLPASATALRLNADSELRLDRMNMKSAGETTISDTSVTLLAGALAGTQRKLDSRSSFQINIPDGEVRIVGTKYQVQADGTVSVIEGEVTITYNSPDNGGSVKATVTAGFSFDTAIGQVVPTTPAYLQNIIANINTTSNNADVFKVAGSTTLVVKPKEVVSPP